MYIARDENNYLFIHNDKPVLQLNYNGLKSWYSKEFFAISNDLFPNIGKCVVAEIKIDISNIEEGVLNE